MSKSKRTAKKPSVKVKDLRPKKNPKGGSLKGSSVSLAKYTATGKHIIKASLP